MTGHPQLGDPVFGLDCTLVTVSDNQGNSQIVIEQTPPAGETPDINLSSTVTFGGILAGFIVGIPISFTVNYFATPVGGGAAGPAPLASKSVTTSPAKLIYSGADTQPTPSPKATSLAPGVYNLTAVVSFGGNPPVTAFAEGGLIEIYP